MVSQQPDEVLVARDDPHLPRVPVHRIGLAEAAEVGVGIGDDLGGEEVFGVGRGDGLGARHWPHATPRK